MLKKVSDEASSLDKTITELENDMLSIDPGTEMYTLLLSQLERLYKLKERHSPKRIDPNTWLVVGGNLAGILIIVSYEHGRVITSKALSFAGKLR